MFDLPAYPGRGIAVHRHHDGRVEWLYFLTGRSDASRQRTLEATADRVTVVPTGDGAHDELRQYACVRALGPTLVIGNGDHVDDLADDLLDGRAVADLAVAIEPEPDPPINTARIAVVATGNATGTEELAPVLVLASRSSDHGTERLLEAVELDPGAGLIIHTYGGGTDDVTTDATIHRFDAGGPGTDVAGRLWHALDPALRVAVAVGLVPEAVPTRVLTERRPEPGHP